MKHTPGPWTWENQQATVWADDFGLQVCGCMSRPGVGMQHDMEVNRANARRIVACVNGCEGINPDAAPGLLAALEAVEWVPMPENTAFEYCPWCENCDFDGHASDCQRQAAIVKAGPIGEQP